MLEIGDKVMWRGCWGRDKPQVAYLRGFELCEKVGDKYGIPMSKIYKKDLNRCVVTLDNGHWAYGTQIDLIKKG